MEQSWKWSCKISLAMAMFCGLKCKGREQHVDFKKTAQNGKWIYNASDRVATFCGMRLASPHWERYVLGLLLACGTPQGRLSQQPQPKHISSSFSRWPALIFFFIFLKFDSFFYFLRSAEQKTKIKGVWRGQEKGIALINAIFRLIILDLESQQTWWA